MMNALPRRLPIETVVKRSYLYAWESRAVLLTPLLIYAAITAFADLALTRTVGTGDHLAVFLLTAVEQIFAMALQVGLHRYVLLGETPGGFQFFRWDRHFIQYALVTLLLFTIGLSAGLMILGMAGDPTAQPPTLGGAAILFSIAVMLFVALVLSRLALSLPAAALGDQVRGRRIWQATEGNGFRLLGATLLTILPFLVIEAALVSQMTSGGNNIGDFVITVLLRMVASVQLIVMTIMLSLSYDVLVRGGGPPARQPNP